MTSAHVARAQMLLHQSRPDLAEAQLRQALAEDPNDGYAHALLALCMSDQDRDKQAEELAHKAVLHAPDLPLAHYALGLAMLRRQKIGAARQAARETIRLDPDSPHHFALLAQVELAEQNWSAALEAAERGLALDASDNDCKNLRAMALVKLGRRDEAQATISQTLADDPEDAFSHANRGWAYLHENDPEESVGAFPRGAAHRAGLRMGPGRARRIA